MRIPLALALLLLAPAATALQESFSDDDFSFSMEMPEGMERVADEQVRQALSLPPEAPFNAPADQMPDGKMLHVYFWGDALGRGRQTRLVLQDGPLPFTRQEGLAAATVEEMRGQGEIDIIDQTSLGPPMYRGGLLIEVRITAPDGVEYGNISTYFVMGPERYAMLSFRARRDDWAVEKPAIMEVLQSVEFTGVAAGTGGPPANQGAPRTSPVGGRPQGPGAAPGRGQGPGQPGAGQADRESWASLEVTGSLVLAVILILGLFAGGRSA